MWEVALEKEQTATEFTIVIFNRLTSPEKAITPEKLASNMVSVYKQILGELSEGQTLGGPKPVRASFK